jgi:hypothetical protein
MMSGMSEGEWDHERYINWMMPASKEVGRFGEVREEAAASAAVGGVVTMLVSWSALDAS